MPGPTELLPYLAATVRDAREHVGVGQARVAGKVDIDIGTIRRIEAGGPWWPQKTDEAILGYSIVSGREPIDLWRDALDRWATALRATAGILPGPGPDSEALGRGLRDEQPSEQSPDHKDAPDQDQRSIDA